MALKGPSPPVLQNIMYMLLVPHPSGCGVIRFSLTAAPPPPLPPPASPSPSPSPSPPLLLPRSGPAQVESALLEFQFFFKIRESRQF